MDSKQYKSHRLLLAKAKPKVDDKPPKLDIDVLYNRQKLNGDALKAKLNYLQNVEVAKKINTVYRTGGKVDCWQTLDKKPIVDQEEKEIINRRTMYENEVLYEKICCKTSELSPQAMAKEWKLLKEQIIANSRYPWYKEVSKYPSITKNSMVPTEKIITKRPRCFFDLELAESELPLGRIVFELYSDYVPSICANFEAFCRGHDGLSYRKTPFHRILPGYWCQGGDVTKFNGTGGASIYKETIPDENFTLHHSCPGVLSTYGGKDSWDSKFNLTFQPMKTVDGEKIVFGKVIRGLQNLSKIEAYGAKFGKPLQKVVVGNCGVLQMKKRKSSHRSSRQKTSYDNN